MTTGDPASVWRGNFGRDYTDRNPRTIEEMDAHYVTTFGISRSALNHEFLSSLDRDIAILEVGSNVGTQLRGLRQMGFERLCGVELQKYAIAKACHLSKDIDFVQASGAALPFADKSFDLVFTSGVLIHIPPAALERVMDEVHRCSRRYIWGWEYFAGSHREVLYRGDPGLLWKGDFVRMYQARHDNLRLVAERRVDYLSNATQPEPLQDSMFLLEKKR